MLDNVRVMKDTQWNERNEETKSNIHSVHLNWLSRLGFDYYYFFLHYNCCGAHTEHICVIEEMWKGKEGPNTRSVVLMSDICQRIHFKSYHPISIRMIPYATMDTESTLKMYAKEKNLSKWIQIHFDIQYAHTVHT